MLAWRPGTAASLAERFCRAITKRSGRRAILSTMEAAERSGAGTAQPQLSIVVPTLGNHELLARVVDAYAHQEAPSDSYELVVVMDAGERHPARVRAVVDAYPHAIRLLQGRRPGASANRNLGWKRTRGEIVLFTDNDTVPVPRLVSEHLDWHLRFPSQEVAVIGLVRWARAVKVTPFMKWLELGIQFDFQSLAGSEASWAHLYSSNCSLKRPLLDRLGGYDEARLPYGYEDLDLGYRARDIGLRVMFNRRAVVDHWRTMTVEQWQARAPRLAVSEWRFCELHPDVEPWFERKFAEAARLAPARGRAAKAARFIPRQTPLLGRAVWSRADLYWRQQIAPHFLEAWNAAAEGSPPALAPGASALAERGTPMGGSAASGQS